MEKIKQKVLDECVKRLNAIGVKYMIVCDNNLIKSPGKFELPEQVKQKKRRGDVKNKLKGLDIDNNLSSMVVGSVIEFKCPENVPLNTLQGMLTLAASRIFGKGNYTSSRDVFKDCVEIMRLA